MRSRQALIAVLLLASAVALGMAEPPALRDAGPGAPQNPTSPPPLLKTLTMQGAPPGAMPSPLPGGPIPDLDLVFTAQVAGWIEPCG